MSKPRALSSRTDDLADLLERFFRDGDEEAMAAVVRRTRRRLLATARGIGDSQDAEDSVQAAYYSLLRRSEPPTDAPVVAWLLTAVVRIAYRRKARKRRADDIARQLAPRLPADTPGGRAARSEEATLLRGEVARLPSRYRDVIVLHHFEGLSTTKIGALLDVPPSTVKTWLRRGRGILEGRMAPLLRGAMLAIPWWWTDVSLAAIKNMSASAVTGGLVKGKIAILTAVALVGVVATSWTVLRTDSTDGAPPREATTAESPSVAPPVADSAPETEPPDDASPPPSLEVERPSETASAVPTAAVPETPDGVIVDPTKRGEPSPPVVEPSPEPKDGQDEKPAGPTPAPKLPDLLQGEGWYLDRSYKVRVDRLDDSRWFVAEKPPFQGVSTTSGPQLYATWSPSSGAGGEPLVTVVVRKLRHSERKDSNTVTRFSWMFENIGESVLVSDVKGLLRGVYSDWLAGAEEVAKKSLRRPQKKKKYGPAKMFAVVQGRGAGEDEITRKEWFTWPGDQVTWFVQVTYRGRALASKDLLAKGLQFMKATRRATKKERKAFEKR